MALRPLVKQTIARTQLEVQEKLDDLLNQNDIEEDSILDVEIEKFGANQFLILAIFYGVYLWRLAIGLVASATPLISMERALSDDIGLVASAIAQLGPVRKAGVGLTSAIARGLYTGNRVCSPLVGLACDVSYTRYHP